jgi:deazaflavin-dependent oxidoreductase (nitroreductase family)
MKQHPHHPHNISIDGSRLLNKYLFNRIIIALAKSGKGPFSVVYHVGRQSGRTYRTPVLASYVEDKIIIPLSYGENVDWLRNILAHGGCEIIYKDRKMGATNPKVIGSMDAFVILPEKRRRLFERFETEKFLLLMVIENK